MLEYIDEVGEVFGEWVVDDEVVLEIKVREVVEFIFEVKDVVDLFDCCCGLLCGGI